MSVADREWKDFLAGHGSDADLSGAEDRVLDALATEAPDGFLPAVTSAPAGHIDAWGGIRVGDRVRHVVGGHQGRVLALVDLDGRHYIKLMADGQDAPVHWHLQSAERLPPPAGTSVWARLAQARRGMRTWENDGAVSLVIPEDDAVHARVAGRYAVGAQVERAHLSHLVRAVRHLRDRVTEEGDWTAEEADLMADVFDFVAWLFGGIDPGPGPA